MLVGVFATTQTAMALDLTGTWVGTQKCKFKSGDVTFKTEDAFTSRMTQITDEEVFIEVDVHDSQFVGLYDGRVGGSLKDPRKGTFGSIWCGNDGDAFNGPSLSPFEYIDSCKAAKVDPATGDGKMLCKGTMVDRHGAGSCKTKATRVDTVDSNIPDCNAPAP